jgi:hypothetical protein
VPEALKTNNFSQDLGKSSPIELQGVSAATPKLREVLRHASE